MMLVLVLKVHPQSQRTQSAQKDCGQVGLSKKYVSDPGSIESHRATVHNHE